MKQNIVIVYNWQIYTTYEFIIFIFTSFIKEGYKYLPIIIGESDIFEKLKYIEAHLFEKACILCGPYGPPIPQPPIPGGPTGGWPFGPM